jgi:hypothetical protein
MSCARISRPRQPCRNGACRPFRPSALSRGPVCRPAPTPPRTCECRG